MTSLDYDKIAERSCYNCHAKGVMSLMLLEGKQYELRMFIAMPDHTLWQNGWNSEALSVGFHNHRLNVSLIGAFGTVYNMRARTQPPYLVPPKGMPPMGVAGYRWSPPLLGGTGKFVQTSREQTVYIKPELLFGQIDLQSDEYHTIFVPKGEKAAWFVAAVMENPAHDTQCWSNVQLDETWNPKDFYLPVSAFEVQQAVERAFPVHRRFLESTIERHMFLFKGLE